ncbi:hypothetical protein B0H63DRAFT_410308 [Podospora didyma]|uniref:Dicer-like protein 1 n=1 Tax=Podospora didyma TaxID=330526 RepID=A0AAE0NZ27_9PEZI|nr:hypothetical protein B0H63DRAFT_410308 [Podospora didyma]
MFRASEALRSASPLQPEGDLMDFSEPLVLLQDEIPTESVGDQDEEEVHEDDVASDSEENEENKNGVKRWVVNEPVEPKPRKISEKKRADYASFNQWIEQNQQTLSKRQAKLLLDEDKSVNALVRSFENKVIITSPRDYQLELFELAKTQNTIAVLDTGSGKTLIAALLLRWTIEKELEDRSKGVPKRIAFFLVDKVALVFQQHAVLTCNLDYSVEKLCGEMVGGASHAFWEKTFGENMAVVCTAEILSLCLHHAHIRMDQINLLIFDEAHHTKKNHPYARIIKDFYVSIEEVEKRPRILGMTASPVDAQIDPRQAAAELEALLHSKIATVADPATLQLTVCKPWHESVVMYDRQPIDWETDLQKSLRRLVGDHDLFQKPLNFCKLATAEMGPWFSDRFWQLYFREEGAVALEFKAERYLLLERIVGKTLDLRNQQLKHAQELVKNYHFKKPALEKSSLSAKVIKLVKVLQDQVKVSGSDRKCIVFVKQRNTAHLLADLLEQPEMKIPGLEVGVLVGGGRTDSGYANQSISFKQQVLTILKFKRGDINCLFATSVAEEGLDIPDCNVIIRFDLYDTLIQYIQSRGRARQEGSLYIHMAERGNAQHTRRIYMNKSQEEVLRKFCAAMPEDRRLTGNNLNMDYFLRKEKGQRQYTVPETGARLNYSQSLTCLATFVASLPHPAEIALHPEYAVTAVPGGFQCEVILPQVSPVRSAIGTVHGSKAVAKCSAAFEMCLALIKGKYLDGNLRPIFTKQLPAMRNARLAISSKKKDQYGIRMKPEIWSAVGPPTELYAMALTLANPAALGRSSSPLLLLSRQPLPQICQFPLYFGTNRFSNVSCVSVPGSVKLSQGKLVNLLTTFTLRIFLDIFSKEYEATPAELPYFLGPTSKDHAFDFASVTDGSTILDWKTLEIVYENDKINYDFDKPDEFFKAKFVTDLWDGSRKFFLNCRRHDLKPTDAVPEGVVAPSHKAWKTANHDIMNYSNSLWSRSRSRHLFQEEQPVVEAELLPMRRNLLDETIADEDNKSQKCFLILEPLKISALPIDVVAMAYTFPATIHRIDSYLIALDACRMLGLTQIPPDLALEALTKDCDNTDEHSAEKINFQGGMGNNYERLELLGDSFLKLATSISIFILNPDSNEFDCHVKRMLLLCNRNLFNNAIEVKLEEYIRSMAFNRRSWYPEGLTLKKGRKNYRRTKHVLGDKSIADVCEALIGAAYLTTREEGTFDLAVQAVTAMVKDKDHAMLTWPEYYEAYKKPRWQTMEANSAQLDMAERFRKRTGYSFKYPRLLRSAFQHPTYPSAWDKLPSYQRLEFLGDALYDMVCVDHLFHRFPGADPQWLTEHKMAMVSNQFMGCLAVTMGFHKAIVLCSQPVQKDLAEYATEVEEALGIAKEEAVKGGRAESDYSRDYWLGCSKPPKCLGDVVESYVAAIFIDSGFDYGTTQSFFNDHVRPFFEDMRLYDTFANKHPVTFLANLMQHKFRCTEWRLIAKELPMDDNFDEEGNLGNPQVICGICVHGQTLTHAVAASSRYAKIAAAKAALHILEEMSSEDFRKIHGCQCVVSDVAEDVEALHGSAV